MNTMQRNKIQSVALSIALMALITLIAGCGRDEPSPDSAEDQAPVEQQPAEDQQTLGHVAEFDDFTLRANVSRTDVLPDAMAEKYGIEPEPDLFLFSLVIQEHRPDQEPVAVSAEVSAKYESLGGRSIDVDMRAVEEDGYVSYIGTLDASTQREFQLIIEAQPEGADEPLHMNFEVLLDRDTARTIRRQ